MRGRGDGRSTAYAASAKVRNNAIPSKGSQDLRTLWSAKKDVELKDDELKDDEDQLPDYVTDDDDTDDDEDNLHAHLHAGAIDNKEKTNIKGPPLQVPLTDEAAYNMLLANSKGLEFTRGEQKDDEAEAWKVL